MIFFCIPTFYLCSDDYLGSSVCMHPSLYPVLLLLSRLHPSAMDGNDSTLNMSAFIPYVQRYTKEDVSSRVHLCVFLSFLSYRCSKSCVLKTRSMAARALVPLVSGVTLKEMLTSLIKSLPVSPNERYNKSWFFI